MTKINEILTLDLREDIKNVIDLEDRSENEIQQELIKQQKIMIKTLEAQVSELTKLMKKILEA